MDSPLLDRFELLSLCAVNQVMPDRRSSVFQNWADNCIVLKKLVSWNPRSLIKLFEEIDLFTCLEVIVLMCMDHERFVSRCTPIA